MAILEKYVPGRAFTYPIKAAERYISIFECYKEQCEEQSALLAAAYYTLANQQDLSPHKCNMHLNSAIALLKKINIEQRKESWNSQLAHAYFKRAEILEEKNAYALASTDYEDVIHLLEDSGNSEILSDIDRILLAKAAISVADLIVSEEVKNDKRKFLHPLFYINKALEHLSKVSESDDDDIWATQAYAHQIAGIALSSHHFEEAKEAFKISLLMAFKNDTAKICPLLADIYTCLGLLYEQSHQTCALEKSSPALLDHALIYFNLSVLFSPFELEDEEEDLLVLESLFELIYRALDPYLSPLSSTLICDIVDALVYAYMCIVDKALPNEALERQLSHPATLDIYAQHIYWLVKEAYYKKYPRQFSLEIITPKYDLYPVDRDHILNLLQNAKSNNILYLKKK